MNQRKTLKVVMPDKTAVTRRAPIPYTHVIAEWDFGGDGWEWSVMTWHMSKVDAEKAIAPLKAWLAVNDTGRDYKILRVKI